MIKIVALDIGGARQFRSIDAGSGYLCQMEPVAHFGLGPFRQVDRISIVWPDGASRVIERPAVNQLHRITHPSP